MANKKSSCLKKLGMGCLGIVGLGIIVGLLFMIGIVINRPKPPELATLNTGQNFQDLEGAGMGLPNSANAQKPVRLFIDVTMLEFDLEPGDDEGRIEIDSRYDKANFELITDIEEKEDHIAYNIRFKNKRSLWALLWGTRGEMEIENRVRVRLPTNLLYQLKARLDMGEFDMDFSGLALADLDINMSKGELDMSMGRPNPVSLDTMKLAASMGEFDIRDFQNFGFAKAEMRGSMGEFNIRSSGPLVQDTDLYVNMSFGEVRVAIPDNADLDSRAGVIFGGFSGPRPEARAGTDPAKLKLRGGVKFGEMRVVRR